MESWILRVSCIVNVKPFRLVWAFAGHTYNIDGVFMLRLKCCVSSDHFLWAPWQMGYLINQKKNELQQVIANNVVCWQVQTQTTLYSLLMRLEIPNYV